jgi:hypothetical protein
MSRRRFSDADRLLNDLLDRHEGSPAASRLVAHIDEEGFASVWARDRFVEALGCAEAAGAVELRHRRVHGETILSHVTLRSPEALYTHLRRTPAKSRVADALERVRSRPDLPGAAGELLDEIAAAWARGVSRLGLAPGDVDGIDDGLTLALALASRQADSESPPTDYRTFSRHAGTDSKALERLARSVVLLYRRLFPDDRPEEGLDADDALSAFGVSRTPQPLLVSGELLHDGVPLPRLLYHGVPPEQGDGLVPARAPDYVLTIENYTSFVRHVRELNAAGSALVLYTGGFPARAHLRQIVRLAAAAGTEVFHWGDLDLGGVRIFHHLEGAMRDQGIHLRPHLMSPDLLKRHGVASVARLSAPTGSAAGSAVAPLWSALAETGLILEQESLAPEHPRKET